MVADLSERHELVSDLFSLPTEAEAWRRFRLTPDQVAFYEEQGYVAGVRVLSEAQCDRLCDELEALVDPAHPGHELFYEFHSNESSTPDTVLLHALGAWRIAPGFHDLLWHPAITVAASQLLGGAPRFWHDQLFCKPARDGGVVAWHQDFSYWTRTKPMAHLTCWLGLDRSTRDNGCLEYVPGSHRWSLLPITGLAGNMEAIRKTLTAEQVAALENPVRIEMERGCAAFHHPLMVHGSRENRTEHPRRATVVNFFRDGVRSDSDRPLLRGVPSIPPGEVMSGKFFPLLLEPSASTGL